LADVVWIESFISDLLNKLGRRLLPELVSFDFNIFKSGCSSGTDSSCCSLGLETLNWFFILGGESLIVALSADKNLLDISSIFSSSTNFPVFPNLTSKIDCLSDCSDVAEIASLLILGILNRTLVDLTKSNSISSSVPSSTLFSEFIAKFGRSFLLIFFVRSTETDGLGVGFFVALFFFKIPSIS